MKQQFDKYHAKRVGTWGELAVAMDLLLKGFEVFYPFNTDSSCDLIALFEGNVKRIEVKTTFSNSGIKRARPGHADILAKVSSEDGNIKYYSLPSLQEMKYLR